MFSALNNDLRYAWRGLHRQPATVAPIVAMLALGLAGCTVFFSLAREILFEPLPYESPEELVMIWNRYGDERTPLSPPDFLDHEHSPAFSEVAASTPASIALEAGDQLIQLEAARVTHSFFDTLGVRPERGAAVFPKSEEDPSSVAAISHGLWVSAFGADPDAVGRTVRIDRTPFQIVAVMPRSFDLPVAAQIWLPLVFDADQTSDQNRGNEFLEVVARLNEGATFEQAEAQVAATAAAVIESVPERAPYLVRNGWSADISQLDDHLLGDARSSAWMLSAAAALLMVIACVNGGVLLLARTVKRSDELRTRSLLGAQPGRLARQLLLENALLSAMAGGLGLALALGVAAASSAALPDGLARFQQLQLDADAVLLTLGLVGLTTLLFGLLPSWLGSRQTTSLSRQVSTRGSSRLRRALVIQEIAIAVVLLVGAGALLREFSRLAALELGFETEDRTTFRVTLPSSAYPDRESRRAFADQLVEQIESWPEVASVVAADRLPLDGRLWGGSFLPEHWTPAPGETNPGGQLNVVTEGYPRTLGVALLEGRDFSPADDIDSPRVAIVDRVAAQRYWPDGALGERLTFDRNADPIVWREIVGVIDHVRLEDLDGRERPQIYLANRQGGLRDLTFAIHTPGTSIANERIREALARVDPSLPAFAVGELEEIYRSALAIPRYRLFFVTALASVALLYCLLGIYSVLSLTVSQRRAEIGLRVALGSSTTRIVLDVLRDGLRMTAWGLLVGAILGVVSLRSLSVLIGTSTPSSAVLAIVGAIALICVTATAATAALPARAAASTNPATTLRE